MIIGNKSVHVSNIETGLYGLTDSLQLHLLYIHFLMCVVLSDTEYIFLN